MTASARAASASASRGRRSQKPERADGDHHEVGIALVDAERAGRQAAEKLQRQGGDEGGGGGDDQEGQRIGRWLAA